MSAAKNGLFEPSPSSATFAWSSREGEQCASTTILTQINLSAAAPDKYYAFICLLVK